MMEAMSTPETIFEQKFPVRPMKRVEFEKLAADGYFERERVELLFGAVVPMPPPNPEHDESTSLVFERLLDRLRTRARVRVQCGFAASDVSEPLPDVVVCPLQDYWREHPAKAFLIIEIARSSLRLDRGPKATLYGLAEVDEYWIVNHIEGVVEVYRDRQNGVWRSKQTYGRGSTIAMLAFPDVTVEVTAILPPEA
jgi:Uma2 family endonuclease